MRKLLWTVCILLLVCVFAFSSCDGRGQTSVTEDANSETSYETETEPKVSETEAHVHAFGEWQSVSEATCTAAGSQERVCVCGEKEAQEVAALGHEETVDAAVAPTCTETGLTEGKHCTRCGEVVVAQTVADALGHAETVVPAVAPTCTETGLTEGKSCSRCGEILVAQTVVNALGHDETFTHSVSPTCTSSGLSGGKHCRRCFVTIVEQTTLRPLGHSEVIDRAVEPTCTKAGLTAGKHCARCLATLVAQKTVSALGHAEVVDAAVAPTCTETGKTEGKHCSRCSTTLAAQTEVAALGHAETDDAAVAPTCTKTGKTAGKHCIRCSKVLVPQETVASLGHIEVIDAGVASTCTETGLTEGKHCSRCSTTLIPQTTIAALGHQEVVDQAIAATCTKEGLTEGKHCIRCSETLVEQTVVSALGHAEVVDAAVTPTCTVDGKTAGKHCSRCGTVLSKQTVVKAPGHNEEIDAAVAPTCTETGLTEGKHCTTCGQVTVAQTVLAALGHQKVVTQRGLPPTCELSGFSEESHCSVCDETLSTYAPLPAKGYDWMLADGEFKLLMIGNSYTQDASNCGQDVVDSQFYSILQSMLGEDVKVTLGIIISGGKSLGWHATRADRNEAIYTLETVTTDCPTWQKSQKMTSADALAWTDWDMVSLQPYFTESGGVEHHGYPDETDTKFMSLETAVPYMLDLVEHYAPQAEAYCYMHLAQSTNIELNADIAFYEKMAAVYPNILAYQGTETGKRFTDLVPAGLAVQNARTTYLALLSYNNGAEVTYKNDVQIGLQRDSGHISFNVGRYLLAMTFAEMLLPDFLRAENYQLPEIRETESVGVLPREYSEIAQKAAVAAVESWRSGSLGVTAIEGYEKDPTEVFAEKFADGLLLKGGEGAESAETQVNALLAANAPDDLVVEAVVLPAEIPANERFAISVTVRFGYTTRTFDIYAVLEVTTDNVTE